MELFRYNHTASGMTALVNQLPNGTFELAWNDGLVNEWAEVYPSLSVAVLRFGALLECAENDFELSFAKNPEDFTQSAEWFLARETN